MTSILIFEHNPDNNHTAHSWIKKRGFKVIGRVNSEEEALRIANGSDPDLAVVVSPSAGFENLSAVAVKIAARLKIPLVFLPAEADEDLFDLIFAGPATGLTTGAITGPNHNRSEPEPSSSPLSSKDLFEFREASGRNHRGDPELNFLKSQIEAARQTLSREIKRRNDAESAWRKSEKQLSSLIKGSPLAVELYNPDGRRAAVSRAVGDIWAGLMEHSHDFNILTDEKIKRLPIYDSIVKAFKGQDVIIHEWSAPPGDQSESLETKQIKSWSRAVRDDDGRLLNIVMFHDDLTPRKKLEGKLHQARQLESLGRMTGGVAHDLNNILQGIVAIPEILLMKLPEDSPHREYLKIMHDSGKRATHVIQDLLSLARKGGQTKEIINLNDILYNFMISKEHLKLKEKYPLLTIEINPLDQVQKINGSENMLIKTAIILIENAAESVSGPGKVVISLENRYLDQPPAKAGDSPIKGEYVVFSVKDTGEAISPHDLERLFEPFYSTKKMGRAGTGLGMPLVWSTVKDHQGHIQVESQPGMGTTFELFFPAAVEETVS